MIPLLGFAPDMEQTTPGVIVDCENFIPYMNGMEGGPSATTPSDVPVLASACMGASVLTRLDGVRRIFAGTATNLYELSGGAWADISRTVGGAYGASDDARWSFAQFGNSALAANKSDTIQRSTSATFADISGAPKADIIFTVGAQVMALNYNDGTDTPDGWYVCALNDDTDWTTSLTTQAAKGRLVSSPGKITAGARLGEYAVAYKQKSLYLGQYVGSPSVWNWTPVAGGEVGCVGKEALCDIGSVHFFIGDDNFWLFDGSRPVPVDNAPRQWFYENSSPSFRYKTKCIYDRQNNRVWIFYPGASSSTCDQTLVYHVLTKKWGRSNRSVEAVLNYISPGLTIDTWSTVGSTTDTLPNVAFDSQYWLAGGQSLSIVNASHQLQNLTGASASSSFTTGDVGDDTQASLLTRLRLRFAPSYAPISAAAQVFGKMSSAGSYATGPTSAMSGAKFDLMQEANWHRATVTFTGQVRVTAADAEYQEAGSR
jgi:hypothetical protein